VVYLISLFTAKAIMKKRIKKATCYITELLMKLNRYHGVSTPRSCWSLNLTLRFTDGGCSSVIILPCALKYSDDKKWSRDCHTCNMQKFNWYSINTVSLISNSVRHCCYFIQKTSQTLTNTNSKILLFKVDNELNTQSYSSKLP